MYSIVSYFFFWLFLALITKYMYPNFFYNIVLYINFYYRKIKKHIYSLKDNNLKILSVDNNKLSDLSIVNYKYCNENFIKLLPYTDNEIDISQLGLDKSRYNSLRKRIECPNSKDSFIMASLKSSYSDKSDIDIIDDVRRLSGLYFDDIKPQLASRYFNYKYKLNGTGLNWSYMMSDGEEYTYNFN